LLRIFVKKAYLMKAPLILVIEDELRLADVLKKQFEDSGFKVDTAADGYLGMGLLENNRYNLIILDINLPLINGYDLCREIRKKDNQVPVIMLTALGTAQNKLTGFDAGADDYVVKPFDFRELLARVNVFLRRTEVKPETEKLSIANLEMDVQTKTVMRGGTRIDLTVKEFHLLETFLRNNNRLLSREFIIEQVWGIDFDPGTNVIDVYVNYLRKKIDKDQEPKLIHTKYGFGFYCSETEL